VGELASGGASECGVREGGTYLVHYIQRKYYYQVSHVVVEQARVYETPSLLGPKKRVQLVMRLEFPLQTYGKKKGSNIQLQGRVQN
jgi:hypothetical protein